MIYIDFIFCVSNKLKFYRTKMTLAKISEKKLDEKYRYKELNQK